MVYEEKFVMKHNIHPLQAVGWEGIVSSSVFGGYKSHVRMIYFSFTKFPQSNFFQDFCT